MLGAHCGCPPVKPYYSYRVPSAFLQTHVPVFSAYDGQKLALAIGGKRKHSTTQLNPPRFHIQGTLPMCPSYSHISEMLVACVTAETKAHRLAIRYRIPQFLC